MEGLIEQFDQTRQDARRASGARSRPARHFGVLVIVSAVGILLSLTWVGVGDAIRAHRKQVEARITAEVANQAVSLEEQFRAELLTIDQTLRILTAAWQRDPAGFDLDAWQRNALVAPDSLLQIFLTDAQGKVQASTRPALLGNDLRDRGYFQAALASDGHDMIIGALRQGPVTQRWQMNLVRRLNRPDGSFGGILSASLDVTALERFYRGFALGPHGIVAVLSKADDHLRTLAGITTPEQRDISIAGSPLRRAIDAGPNGSWIGASPPDGTQRILAFRQVPERDLAVVVGVDRAAALVQEAGWEQGAWIFGGCISLLLLALAALLLRLDGVARQREAVLGQERTALAEKSAQLEATLAGMSDGIMMVDADLRLLAWNDRFPDYTGVPREALRLGMSMEDILRAQAKVGEFGAVEIEPEVARRVALLRSGGSTGTLQRVRPNGRVLELRRNPIAGGGFVTLYGDVTARHQAEERLRQTQKMAAIGRLTAGIAHDFNNLLSSISGNAELIEGQLSSDPTLSRRLSIILQAAGRGADLVRQLLAFARQQPLEPIAVDLNGIVRGMKELLQSTLGRAIRVETRLAAAAWPALVDPVQIEHVILNLAINARDAMPGGGVLTVTTANVRFTEPRRADEVPPGEYVSVAVSDTGTGMSPDVLRSAFEPFFTTKPAGQGSGLGLSQVYGVASQSGGGVQIDSTPGRGTTVTVFLPRAAADAVVAPRADIPRPGPGEAAAEKGTVLLVDDEADVRETIAAMLGASGFKVRIAADGPAALRMVEAGDKFDLLLVDLVMPGMGGVELAASLRARRPALPVVFITGYREDERISDERWVLTKPFVASRLAAVVDAALHRARGQAALGADAR